jgi:maleylacetate reductase
VFGAGRRHDARAELATLGTQPLVIVDPVAACVAADVVDAIAPRAAAVIDEVRQHVPVADAEAARRIADGSGADCLAAIGGGSAVGLAKAIALTSGLPILAVPTTYAGSEATPVWGLTDERAKRTGRDPRVAPRIVVYDPDLTASLPAELAASSALNALAHCVDALWAAGRTPLTDVTAEQGIRLLAGALPRSLGGDPTARAELLAGAWLAGTAFGVAGSSLHHKLCHALGGRFDLPHAQTHAVMLPHVAALAAPRAPEAAAILRRAFDDPDPVAAVRRLAAGAGAPSSLAEFGLTPADASRLADDLCGSAFNATFVVDVADVRQLLVAAVQGRANHRYPGGEACLR